MTDEEKKDQIPSEEEKGATEPSADPFFEQGADPSDESREESNVAGQADIDEALQGLTDAVSQAAGGTDEVGALIETETSPQELEGESRAATEQDVTQNEQGGVDQPSDPVSVSPDDAAPHSTAAQGEGTDADLKELELPDLSADAKPDGQRDISILRDVDLRVQVELGRTRMYIEDVLQLGEGGVVELDNLAGDPVDVVVNGRLIARGEVLVLGDNFCVRVNEIISGPQNVAVA